MNSMESRPRSVLAAFQEHLQIASTKCGTLMEQLNIVRKKVEGKEAMMKSSDPVSNGFLENVSQKTVLQSEGMDVVDRKDVHNNEQMAVSNAYVKRSTGDKNCDLNKHLMVRTSSYHSEIMHKNEEVPFQNGNFTSDEKDRFCLKSDGARNQKRSEEKLLTETEKISGKAGLNVKGDGKGSSNQDALSDNESTLSSFSSSNDDCQDASNKENVYEELLKRLKMNEEKKNNKNMRSSSENSSSSFQKATKSPKKQSSNSTINEDNLDKRPSEIENLHAGVDFFLPSSVTEKFQEMFYEDSGEEEQNNSNRDKNMRITFDDLIIGRPKKHSINGEIQNKSLNETKLKTKVSPNQTKQHKSNNIKNTKVNDKFYDASSVKSKSEKSKKPNTVVCSSALMNYKLHSPEMNLYKRLNGVPLKHEMKKNSGRKDYKSKKNTIANSRFKSKQVLRDPKVKSISDKKNSIAFNNPKNLRNEIELSSTMSNAKKGVGKDMIIINNTQQKNPSVADSSLITNQISENGIVFTNHQTKKVEKGRLSCDGNIKRASLDETFGYKEEVKHDQIITSDPKNLVSKKEHVNKPNGRGNLKEKPNSDPRNMVIKKNHTKTSENQGQGTSKEKLNSDLKNLISKKDHFNKLEDHIKLKERHNLESKKLIPKKNVIKACEQDILKEKSVQAPQNQISKEKRPATNLNNMRTVTKGKDLSSMNSSIIDETPSIPKLKNNNKELRSNTSGKIIQPKKEWNKNRVLSATKEDKLAVKSLQSFDKRSKVKEPSISLKGRHHNAKEVVHSQSLNEIKNHTASFPFILGQSTSKTYNVRAAIQQTMSMIMRSPAETLRRSSFSEMLNVSSKASTLKTSVSATSARKTCPACITRVEEEDYEADENPLDPWDTEYHSKRFIRCTCMPRNTVNFKTVMNQLLLETSSSYILPTESYHDSELENGEDNRVKKFPFRKNNNIYKLSKLLHTLLKIRDLLVT